MTERIRLCQVLETIHLGGVEQRVRTLVRGLDPKLYEHLVICTQGAGAIPDELRELGARVEMVGRFLHRIDVAAIRRTACLLREFRADIVHAGVFEGVIMGVLGGHLACVPVIVSEETSDAYGRRATGHALSKLLYSISDVTIAVSPFVERYLIGRLRLPERKVKLIANAVSEPPPPDPVRRSTIRREFSIPPGSLVLGTLGRLQDAHKGVSDAICALSHPALSATYLLVIGDGPDRDALAQLAARIGVSERVRFAGYQSEPAPFLAALDIFVHPARFEAFGLVIAEAMFAGLPVVASRVGGIPDVVADGETGILVKPNDPAELANELARLAADPARCRVLGEAGRSRSHRLFGVQNYVASVDQLYRKLLARKMR